MKEGWECSKLGDVAEIKGGKRVPKGYKFEPTQTEHIYIRVADFNNDGTIALDDLQYINNDVYEKIKRYTITSEDVYISIAGTIGKSGIIPKELDGANLTENACKLVLKGQVCKEFIYYTTLSPNFKAQINKMTKVSSQPKLALARLEQVVISFPNNISEQQQIVEYLDAQFKRIDALKANTEQQLQAAKDLFQSALKDLMTPKEGWEMTTIGKIFKSYSGGTPLKSKQEYYNNATIPWLNSGEVCQKYITNTNNYISELGLKNSSAKFFPINTVLIAMYGATAAQAGILKFEATTNQAICGLLPIKEMIPEFVYYWFLYNKAEFAAMAQGGAQPNLSQVKIKSMPIPTISIEQQKIICSKLEIYEAKVKQLQTNYEQTITLCNDLKQSLLKKVFE